MDHHELVRLVLDFQMFRTEDRMKKTIPSLSLLDFN